MISTGNVAALDVEFDERHESDYELACKEGWRTGIQVADMIGRHRNTVYERIKRIRHLPDMESIEVYHPVAQKPVLMYRHKSRSDDWDEILKGEYAFIDIPDGWLDAEEIGEKYKKSSQVVRRKLERHSEVDRVVGRRGADATKRTYYNNDHIEGLYGRGTTLDRIGVKRDGRMVGIYPNHKNLMTKEEWDELKTRVDCEFANIIGLRLV